MQTVFINQRELCSIELIRTGLSEDTLSLRKRAITLVKHDIIGTQIALLDEKCGPGWPSEAENAELVRWIAKTTAERQEAVHAFSEISQRYEKTTERKLNVAEHIGKLILHSIQDGKFQGVHTPGGILEQVRDVATKEKIRGAIDKDVVRKLWKSYRGVVHLGIAIDYCEDNPDLQVDLLAMAERIRRTLSQSYPKGTKKPYVDQSRQISFLYISTLSGPRFRNRGLPFGVN